MKVIVTREANEPEEFIIDKEIVILGRKNTCDICIVTEHISREHLEISIKSGNIYIKDLTSSNWVVYNDEKLEKDIATKYFDFGGLALPGGVSILIEQGRSFEIDSLASEMTAVNLEVASRTPAKLRKKMAPKKLDLVEKVDGVGIKRGRVRKREASKESKNDIFLMIKKKSPLILIFLGVIVLTYSFLSGDKKGELIGKVEKTPAKIVQKIQHSSESSRTIIKASFEKNMLHRKKCSTSLGKDLCRIMLKNKSSLEGVIWSGKHLVVLKNLQTRVLEIFSKNSLFAKNALEVSGVEGVIAGEYLLYPSVIKKLIKEKIKKVSIFIFTKKHSKPYYHSSYTVQVKNHKEYRTEDYKEAFRRFKKDLDVKYFNKLFLNVLIKD